MRKLIKLMRSTIIAGATALAIILFMSAVGVFDESVEAAEVDYIPVAVGEIHGTQAPAIDWLALREEALQEALEQLEVPERVSPEPPQPESAIRYISDTKTEIELLAQTVWGEARGCSDEQKELVVWTILNRVDDGRFGKDIRAVITAPHQFDGYCESNPVNDDILALCEQVVHDWKMGQRGMPIEYLYFYGDGAINHFYSEEGVFYNE